MTPPDDAIREGARRGSQRRGLGIESGDRRRGARTALIDPFDLFFDAFFDGALVVEAFLAPPGML
jgi:hypothetical protein